MKCLSILFLIFFSFEVSSQIDSVSECCTEMDTVFVLDTVITIDTVLVKRVKSSDNDTLVLKSHKQSWSSIPEKEKAVSKKIIHRNDSGKFLVTAKISFSDTSDDADWEGYSIGMLPPLALQVEYFQNDYLSYGAQFLYARDKYSNDTLSTSYMKNSTMGLAGIGTFHYGDWLQNVTNDWVRFGYLDLYFSMAVRFDVHRSVVNDWNEELNQYAAGVKTKDAYVSLKLRPIFGARYYISDRFSVNFELGKGNLGMLSSSVSWVLPNSSFNKLKF